MFISLRLSPFLAMIAATQCEIEQHGCQPLSQLKEKPITDLINQLDIADGLEFLISKSFSLKMLLDTPVSRSAKRLVDDGFNPHKP
jgi:hypothetical protein